MTEPDLLQGHSLIHLRDARFGRTHYLLPPDEAEKLATFLTKQAEQARELPDKGKRN